MKASDYDEENKSMIQYENKNEHVISNNIDDELIAAYIGKNSLGLENGNFKEVANSNFYLIYVYFIFGSCYIFYRKMWLFGFVVLLISIILTIIKQYLISPLDIYLNIFVTFIEASVFKTLYRKKAKVEVQKIKAKNSNATLEELKQICSKKGGTTLVPVIIYIIVLILLIFYFY